MNFKFTSKAWKCQITTARRLCAKRLYFNNAGKYKTFQPATGGGGLVGNPFCHYSANEVIHHQASSQWVVLPVSGGGGPAYRRSFQGTTLGWPKCKYKE